MVVSYRRPRDKGISLRAFEDSSDIRRYEIWRGTSKEDKSGKGGVKEEGGR